MYETHISRMKENPLYKIVGCKVCDVIVSSCFDSIERKQGEWDFIKWMEFVVP